MRQRGYQEWIVSVNEVLRKAIFDAHHDTSWNHFVCRDWLNRVAKFHVVQLRCDLAPADLLCRVIAQQVRTEKSFVVDYDRRSPLKGFTKNP